jgi:hypothetical protein
MHEKSASYCGILFKGCVIIRSGITFQLHSLLVDEANN